MSVKILTGDCRAVLQSMRTASVDCIVTSPPYYGLRDYGTAQWNGGDEGCDHVVGELRLGLGMEALGAKYRGGGKKAAKVESIKAKGECPHCGATRIDSQIGLEATPDDYVKELVGVFAECRRVLKNSGTLWLNLGDSYNSGTQFNASSGLGVADRYTEAEGRRWGGHRALISGLKAKDLIGIPWLVAFALRADGWYLRSDIIWSKPNPMPESVTDRPTKAHEYVFLLSKAPRYYFDADAVRETASWQRDNNPDWQVQRSETNAKKGMGNRNAAAGGFTQWSSEQGRNIRSVWEIATQPYSEAHFATFPPDLIEPCIKAGCPIGGTVLDPFGGAGTTGLVADRLQRNAILIELNPEYAAMAERRIHADAPLFMEPAVA